MSPSSSDPAAHRQRERQFIEHCERLLTDERLRVDTTTGRRPVTVFGQEVARADKSVELKRLMSQVGRPDRDLEASMPTGESLDVTLTQKKLLFMRDAVGRVRVVCLSPTRALLNGTAPEPVGKGEVEKAIATNPLASAAATVPSTVVVLSTSGFAPEAHDLAERRADRTMILVEPNDAGGYTVYGPVETKALSDLFDPEADETKRQRVRDVIEESSAELADSGIATDKLVVRTQLPQQLVEAELKAYAKSHPGLLAKRLDGRVVLFREGSVPAASATSSARSGGAEAMPLIDRIKSLFARKGETEKKIAFLSERRAALGQQRERLYEEIAGLETKDTALRRQFKEHNADLAKRRVTTQLVQLRKDMERRQQMLAVLNQQINVVSTHLHNLELVQQGSTAQLPDSEEMANDAAAAEEMIAKLEADAELADSVAGGMTGTSKAGMNAEEQAMFEELTREAASTSTTAGTVPKQQAPPAGAVAMPSGERIEPPPIKGVPEQRERGRAEPEAG
jgi:hypothetical protein